VSTKHRSLPAPSRFRPASDPRRTLGASLDFLEPPYAAYRPATLLAGTSSLAAQANLVLAVRLTDAAQAGVVVAHVLARLAVLAPTVPRIVRLEPGTDARMLSQAFHLGRLHAHAIIVDGQDPADALRPMLTDHSMVASMTTEWLGSRMRTLPQDVRAELADRIAAERPAEEEAREDDRAVGIVSAWRAKLRRLRIPPPVQWTCLARAIRAAVLIQAAPRRRIADVAFELGFEEQSSLNALISRSFGLRPAELRGTLGVCWLMDRWAVRNGIATEDLLQIELKRVMRSYGVG
jgi:hypothetical protein